MLPNGGIIYVNMLPNGGRIKAGLKYVIVKILGRTINDAKRREI